eukprot:PhM_4_TR7334/c0_g1_i1/m.46005/K01192/E3.2.1.25, MANBA, manB; beta-mannosidase
MKLYKNMSQPGALFVIMLITATVCTATTRVQRVPLNGGHDVWRFSQINNASDTRVFAGTVPGVVHTDLMANGVLADPYFGFNDVAYQWVAMQNWSYTRTFRLSSASVTTTTTTTLIMEGVDTIASIEINGKVVARVNNQHRTWRIPVPSSYLEASDNTITVNFTSAVSYAQAEFERWRPVPGAPGGGVVPNCPLDVQHGFCHFPFVRKEACSFSWDWGPAFATMGIHRSLYLLIVDNDNDGDAMHVPEIRNVLVATTTTSKVVSNNEWSVTLDILFENTSSNVIIPRLDVHSTVCRGSFDNVTVSDGRARVVLPSCAPVAPWYPVNFRSGPTLYNFNISVDPNRAPKAIRIGFREVALVQEPVAGSPGKSFYLTINGEPIYIKGANWIPADAFSSRVSRSVLQSHFDTFVRSNFNMVRNWGGGAYETDGFYDLADERGIMVWEEFKFACATYSNESSFLLNVAQEVQDNTERLQRHASIVVWGGNNENEVLIQQDWYGPTAGNAVYAGMFSDLYFRTVLSNITSIDIAARPVLSSSPSNGYETVDAPLAQDPQDPHYGDMHVYNYNDDCWLPETFPSGRFSSEYGYQSLPSTITMGAVAPSPLSEHLAWGSAFLSHRQHHTDGYEQMKNMIALRFPAPNYNDTRVAYYMTQLYHGVCLRLETEHYRRLRDSTGTVRNMGALYWQANDIWQAPTWSTVEYGGRWKLAQYLMRHAFQNVHVSARYVDNGAKEVMVVAISDDPGAAPTDAISQVTLQLGSLRERSLFDAHRITVKNIGAISNDARTVYKNDTDAIVHALFPKNKSPPCLDELYLKLTAWGGNGNAIASNIFFLGNLAKLTTSLPNPQISVESVVAVSEAVINVTLVSQETAAFVWLETQYNGTWEDNGLVVLLPGTTTIGFYMKATETSAGAAAVVISPQQLKGSIQILSLYDAQQK